MKITRFSVCLQRLEIHQLELLRYWRNNKHISQFMEYREHITEAMQLEWFHKTNNIHNFFFIINYNETNIGLINTSKIDFEKGTADTGLFIWDDNYLNSQIPALASMAMLDVFFKLFELQKVNAKVKNNNLKAINYNAALGFQKNSDNTQSDFSLYELSHAHYFKHAHKLRHAAEKLYSNKTLINLNSKTPYFEHIIQKIHSVPDENKKNLNLFLHLE